MKEKRHGRERESERECAGECDGEEGEEGSAPRSRRKECRFTVESKAFEIIVDERRKNTSPHCGEEGRGFVMGLIGIEHPRVFLRRAESLYQG